MSLGVKAAKAAASSPVFGSKLVPFVWTAQEAHDAGHLRKSPRHDRLNSEDAPQLSVSAAARKPPGDDSAKSLPLSSYSVAVKDNICTSTDPQLPTTCDSNILGPAFLSPYNATVIDLLEKNGCNVIGKTSMDEFGMGSHSIHTTFGEVYQEDEQGKKLSVGGSSGGSALAAKGVWKDRHGANESQEAPRGTFALGTDTGGSVRLPASYTGTVGFKPSYGLLSRWGVIPYANSLDTVGLLANRSFFLKGGLREIFETLNQFDPKDPTSLPPSTRSRIASMAEKARQRSRPGLKIGVPIEYNIQELDPSVRDAWQTTLTTLTEKHNCTIIPVSLPRTKEALSAYYVLAPAEASSNLAKYDGIRYGHRASSVADNLSSGTLYAQTRGEGFGSEVQRRILLGAYTLSAYALDNYFIQAQKVRRFVQQDFDNVFASPNPLHNSPTTATTTSSVASKVDFILSPTAPTPPPLLSKVKRQDKDPLQAYMNDVFTVPASLAGLPAISIPSSGDERIGMQIIGQVGGDEGVLEFAREVLGG